MNHIEAAYFSTAPRIPGVTLDEFARLTRACEVHPVSVDGKPAGAVFVLGNEIHACIMPWAKGRWMSKATLRILSDVVRKNGKAVTTATTKEGEAFVKRLGFAQEGEWWVCYGV